jgi:hypothetical protein
LFLVQSGSLRSTVATQFMVVRSTRATPRHGTGCALPTTAIVKTMSRTRTVSADPAAELATTFATLTFFHGAVQHADDKARTVVAIQTMLTAMVAAQLTFLVKPNVIAQLMILAVFVPGYLQSSCHLLGALIPRTAPTLGHNQFAFPSVANDLDPVRVSVREQCTQAHEVVRVLANLAMVKHRHIRRAVYGTCALFVSALGSLVLTVVS